MIPTVSTQNFHPWISVDSQKLATKLDRQAFAYNVLSKITFAAIAAICASVLVTSFVLGSATGTLPFILVGLVVSTPFLAIASTALQTKSLSALSQAKREQKVADEFKKIEGEPDDKIKAYLIKRGVVPPSNVPLRTLLPLIARYEARESEALEEIRHSYELLHKTDCATTADRTVALTARRLGWEKLEQKSAPAALEAALILEILSQPTLKTQLSDLGSMVQKSFEERQFDRLYGPNDNIFVSHESTGNPPITFRTLENARFSPQAIRTLLFPKIQAAEVASAI